MTGDEFLQRLDKALELRFTLTDFRVTLALELHPEGLDVQHFKERYGIPDSRTRDAMDRLIDRGYVRKSEGGGRYGFGRPGSPERTARYFLISPIV